MSRSPKTLAVGLFSIAALSFVASPVVAKTMASAADSAFLMKASQANLAEVAAGKMAEQKGSSMAVRDLGKHLATDHAMNQQKLMALAKTLNVTLPTHPAAADKAMMMKADAMSGSAFDSAYVMMEEQGHMKNIAAFKSEAGMTKNAMVASYVKMTLPALEAHLQFAESDAHSMKMKMSSGAMGSGMGSGAMGSGSMGSGTMGSGSMGSGSMGSGSMGSGASGSQNSGKSSSSGGQDGTPASSGAGGSNSRSMSSPMPMASGSMNSTSGGQVGTPASSGAGGSGNTNTGPNTSGTGGGAAPMPAGSGPVPNNGTGAAPNPSASPVVPPGQKTN